MIRLEDLRDLRFFWVKREGVWSADVETSPWERAVEEAIESAVETGREQEVVPACKDEWRDGTGDGGAGREEEMPEMLR